MGIRHNSVWRSCNGHRKHTVCLVGTSVPNPNARHAPFQTETGEFGSSSRVAIVFGKLGIPVYDALLSPAGIRVITQRGRPIAHTTRYVHGHTRADQWSIIRPVRLARTACWGPYSIRGSMDHHGSLPNSIFTQAVDCDTPDGPKFGDCIIQFS